MAVNAAFAQGFSDMFADRQLLIGTSATVLGSNTNATVEPSEPLHAGKIGGHSVWISWQASDNGLVTLSTSTSSFDTLLAVYSLQPGNDPSLQRLQEIAANDDSRGSMTSYLQFGANSNRIYQIAVDGYNGATGDIVLQVNFLTSSNLQPTIVRRPGDQALRLGDPLILTMGVVPGGHSDLTWYLNGNRLSAGSGSPTLVIPSLQITNLGFYSVRMELNDDNFFSTPVEVQINSEGQSGVLARYKLPDAAKSGLLTRSVGGGGVMLGYNGVQMFNTTNAIVDPNAPTICGVIGGAPYWFAYQAPTNGLLSIDTGGSGFDTLLAAFTYVGPLLSFTNLISLACDNNSGPSGLTSQIQFLVAAGQTYFIVVDGVNGARGVARLNYSLAAGISAQPPAFSSQPQPLVVARQTAVALSVVAGGTAPLSYQWWQNNSLLAQQTNASLLLLSPQSQNNGDYTVVVTNIVGAVTSSPASVSVINSPLTTINTTSNQMISAFPGTRGFQYSVDCSSGSLGGWWRWTNAFPDYGGIIWLTNGTQDYDALFFRVHSP